MTPIPIATEQWQKLYEFLRAHSNVYAGKEKECRRFIEGVYWILRTGAQWRELPEQYGKWNSVYKRFARWEEGGIWAQIYDHFAQDPDMTAVMLDSTAVRAHMCAAGGSKKNGGQAQQALGRSRAGFSSKIHIVADARGHPLRFSLTGAERHDVTQAEPLLAPLQFDYAIADRAYDSAPLLALIAAKEAAAVIPPATQPQGTTGL